MSCSTLSVSSEWESQGESDSVESGATGERSKEVETDRYQKIVRLFIDIGIYGFNQHYNDVLCS